MQKSDQQEIRKALDDFVGGWQTGDAETITAVLALDPVLDFSILPEGLTRQEFVRQLIKRPVVTSYVKFRLLNYVAGICKGRARQSAAMTGTFAGQQDGRWTFFRFEGTFANELVRTEQGWNFTALRFEMTDENGTVWPRLNPDGIPQKDGIGTYAYVSHWALQRHDDRIGWYEDKRIPSVIAEYDSPWAFADQRENPGSDRDQIRETFFKYAYGIDFDYFNLYKEVFTKDALIIYGDDRPYDLRGDIDMLKAERQGSCRCVHTGFFSSIDVYDKNQAEADLYLMGTYVPQGFIPTEESVREDWAWARYHLIYRKEDGFWKIHRLNFYPGFLKLTKDPASY